MLSEFLLLMMNDNFDNKSSVYSCTYWGREESLLAGRLAAGPQAGVMGCGVTMEWQVSSGEVW